MDSTNTNKPTKIAVIGCRGIPATYGGVEKAVEELYAELADHGYEVVVYGRKYYLQAGITEHRGVTIKHLYVPNIRGLEAFLHSLLATLLAINSDAEILHFHAQGPAIFSRLAKWLAPHKHVGFTCQGIDWQRDKWGPIERWIIRQGEKASAKYPDFRIGVSQHLVDHYHQTYGVALTCIPNGVRLPNDVLPNPEILAKLGLNSKKYVMFCGRLVPEKAIDHLVQSFLKVSHPDFQLAIVGDTAGTDEYTQRLHQLAQQDSRIVFTGYQFGESLQQLYANAFAYVTASKLEGLPLSLLEAMSYGLPVIVSDIGPHTEVINKNPQCGFTFPVADLLACETSISRMLQLSDEQRTLMGQVSRQIVAEHFSWSLIAQQTIQAMRC